MNEDTILFGDDQGKGDHFADLVNYFWKHSGSDIFVYSLELELDHVNPLHPYIHNYVYSPYWFLVYIS